MSPSKANIDRVSHESNASTKSNPEDMSQTQKSNHPETYYLKTPTPHVPNSLLPVLIYRSVFPTNSTPDIICKQIEPNNWLRGGVFGHFAHHHFHSITHECYAVFRGYSRLLLGKGPLDESTEGIEVDLKEGDAIVLPAGVAHCSLESGGEYGYVGLYPKGSPHWDNNMCKADPEETAEKATNARYVPIPDFDPVFGAEGPLVRIWENAIYGDNASAYVQGMRNQTRYAKAS